MTSQPQLTLIDPILSKLTKALLDFFIFPDGKNSSIDQKLSKLRDKFEINHNYYLLRKRELEYIENRVKRKALYLQLYLQFNVITSFTTINNLFNHFKDLFSNFH